MDSKQGECRVIKKFSSLADIIVFLREHPGDYRIASYDTNRIEVYLTAIHCDHDYGEEGYCLNCNHKKDLSADIDRWTDSLLGK